MSQPVKPPDEVFCMRCGPGTILDADPGAHRLRCPRCGTESPLPALPLFVVTGASGTGKSTITGPLRTLLPGCLVAETDVILHVAALGWDTWRNTWLQLAHAAALGRQATVLTGSLTPDQLERLPARKLIGPIHFALLDCPDDVLAGFYCEPAQRGAAHPARRRSSSTSGSPRGCAPASRRRSTQAPPAPPRWPAGSRPGSRCCFLTRSHPLRSPARDQVEDSVLSGNAKAL